MEPVRIVQGTAVPLDRSNVDTDQIIPSDWLKRVERTGFEKGLFSEWRDDPSFVMNDERFVRASILVAGPDLPVSMSPQEGFLHERAEVDTLGIDEPESKCKFQ